jgi:hypothetical protein
MSRPISSTASSAAWLFAARLTGHRRPNAADKKETSKGQSITNAMLPIQLSASDAIAKL